MVNIGSGMDYKHLGEGNIPVYGTGGYMCSVDKALSNDKDAIGIGRKGTIDKPYLLRAPFWTVDTLFYCIPKEDYDLDFTSCLFQNVDWKKKDESTGVPSLSKLIISNVETDTPTFDEQIKIGEYFSNLDHLITLHHRKYMKNIDLSLFAWEQRKLEAVLSLLKDGTHGTHQDAEEGPYLLSAKNIKNGQIIIDDSSDRKISEDEFNQIHTKFTLENGDILLTIVGSIGESAILENAGKFTFQRSVAFLRPSEEMTSRFLKTEIESVQFQKELNDRKSQSAQPGVYLGDLSKIPIYITSKEEQKKIGKYFSHLDNLITLHHRKQIYVLNTRIYAKTTLIITKEKKKMPELEKVIEDKLIEQLVFGESQWTYREDLKTEEDLWKNFRYILEQNNKARLDGQPLSDAEFEQVKNQLQFSSFYKAGEWLVGENGKAMVHVQRDTEKLHFIMVS